MVNNIAFFFFIVITSKIWEKWVTRFLFLQITWYKILIGAWKASLVFPLAMLPKGVRIKKHY